MMIVFTGTFLTMITVALQRLAIVRKIVRQPWATVARGALSRTCDEQIDLRRRAASAINCPSQPVDGCGWIGQVRWQPTKLLPPMSDEEWAAEFEEYKKFPEFQVGACVRPNRIRQSVSRRRHGTVRQAQLSLANHTYVRASYTVRQTAVRLWFGSRLCSLPRTVSHVLQVAKRQPGMSTWPHVSTAMYTVRKARHTVTRESAYLLGAGAQQHDDGRRIQADLLLGIFAPHVG
jgi:hypothetical protein